MLSGSPVVEASLAVPRFANAFATCPICRADDVEYEFVVERVALSRCRACTQLFANPASERTDAQVRADVPLPALRVFAERYLGRAPMRVLVVDGAGDPYELAGADRVRLDALDALDPARRYDAVLACEAIDRDPDPLRVLAALRRTLEPDGVLLVAMPSLASHAARSMRENWPPLRSKAAWWYTPDTAQLLLTRAGFGDFVTLTDNRDAVAAGTPIPAYLESNFAVLARPVARPERKTLSVIVPVFNEARTVAELLDAVLAKSIESVEVEVIVVESGSSDGSREIVQRYAQHPRVTVVLEERPQGKGAAVRAGLAHARGDVVLFQDADLEYDVSDYDRLVEPLFALRRNFVLGSRHGATRDGWKIRRFEERRVVSSAMNLAHLALVTLFNRLYDQSVFDPFTMFKVFRRDCLYGVDFVCNRFDFDIEIVAKLYRKGYRPLEIPVNYRSRSFREGKKVAFFSDPPTWVKAMLRVRREPLYAFGPTESPVTSP